MSELRSRLKIASMADAVIRPPVGTGATGAKAPVNFEQRVPDARPETECTYHKFSNEGYNCL